ncbi:methyltransferase domain-containing protein [Methylibium sp.]|uniref:methyltransferase domain-containing protein n=1 Tax=Methylibium sp. TaxID=2067992 RepID=UPI003D0E912E
MEDDQRLAFYRQTLAAQVADRSAKILVLAAGKRDKMVFEGLGYRDVTFSNVDDTYGAEREFTPFGFARLDAEQLAVDDEAFDFVVIHAALHHCHSPHRALLEMYRTARVGVLVFEARDSALMRLLERRGLTETYEQRGVYFNGGAFGGVRNGPVPNFIYRWTEREVEKTISTFAPHAQHTFAYHYGHDAPAALLYPGRAARKALLRSAYWLYKGFAAAMPRQQNLFSFYVGKGPLQPWITVRDGKPWFDMEWAQSRFG